MTNGLSDRTTEGEGDLFTNGLSDGTTDGEGDMLTNGLSDGTTDGEEELDEIGDDVGAPKKVGGSVGELGIEVGGTTGVYVT